MTGRLRLGALLLALLLAAVPVTAAEPADYETFLLDAAPGLGGLAGGEKGLAEIARATQAYVEERLPAADQAARDAFLANLESRLARMSGEELDDLAARALRQNGAADQGQRAESAFHDKLDAIAFYTVASGAVLDDMSRRVAEIERTGEKPGTPSGLAWSRGPAGTYRLADAQTPWAAIEASFAEFKRLDGLDWGNKKSFVNETGLPTTEDAWVDQFERRLLRLFGDPGLPLGGALARDLARAQYLMLAPKPAPNSNELVVTDHLVGLARKLEPFAITPDQLDQLHPALQRRFAELATREIDAVLGGREQDHDFRTVRLIPDGPLAETEFLSLIAAGYVLDDVGAGVEHGAASHRIQWYALTEYFEQGDGGWHHTPAELYTALGAYDVARARFNEANRFAFERAASLWAHLFDQQGGRGDAPTDLSRPDFLRPILNGDPRLAPLAHRIEVIYRERQGSAARLRAAYSSGERLPFRLTSAERGRIDALLAREALAAGDELYMLGYFKAARASGRYTRVRDEGGERTPLLIERGASLERARDEAAIADTRRQWSDKVRGGEPRRVAADRPRRIAVHETAATSDYRRKRREPVDGGAARPAPPLAVEGPALPHPDEEVAAIDPRHAPARLAGEEDDPDIPQGERPGGASAGSEDRDDDEADPREKQRAERSGRGGTDRR